MRERLKSKYGENRATGKKARPSTALGKEEMAVHLQAIRDDYP
jgi:hypothetical protein